MAGDNLLDLISRELDLYRLLVAEQEQKVSLYLQGDLDLVKSSMERDKNLLEGIRAIHQSLRKELDGQTLSETLAGLDTSESSILRMKIEELRRLVKELGRMNLQNYRYTRSSFGFTRAMLGEIFSENTNYNQNGYLQTGGTVVEF
jgi:hypothetical protein